MRRGGHKCVEGGHRCIFCDCVREDPKGRLKALCRLFGWRDYPDECNTDCPEYEEI